MPMPPRGVSLKQLIANYLHTILYGVRNALGRETASNWRRVDTICPTGHDAVSIATQAPSPADETASGAEGGSGGDASRGRSEGGPCFMQTARILISAGELLVMRD